MRDAHALGSAQMTVIGLVDRTIAASGQIPRLFEVCCSKIMTDLFELQRFISGLARRRALEARALQRNSRKTGGHLLPGL